ncbi:MAG: 50S ribosomal protein L18 [Patescibacteria group bacterium]
MATTLLNKKELRDRRHRRVRAKITGTAERPRLAVSKSNKFISAQLIDDDAQKTVAASHGRSFPGPLGKQAPAVGAAIAAAAKKAGITTVVFDRGGFEYGGQIEAVANAAREGGLTF